MGWIKSLATYLPLSGLLMAEAPNPPVGLAVPLSKDNHTRNVVVEVKLERVESGRQPTPSPQPILASPLLPLPDATSNPPPPKFPTFNSQQLDQQLQRFLDYLAKNGAPDVLIVGSSRSLQGIDPITLQNVLAQQGYPNLKIYNFGINGATAQVVDWLLRQLIPPDQLPRLIVWGDGSRAFNDGRLDHTFNNIVASPGNRLLAGGIRPRFPNRLGEFELGRLCMDLLPAISSPSAPPLLPSTATSSIPSLQGKLPCQHPLRVLVRQRIIAPRTAPQFSPETLGFQVVATQFVPRAYFQHYAKVPGTYDADYFNFSLTGRQFQAFDRVIQLANSHKIPLIFVNLPLTPIYLDATRRAYEERFRSRMNQFSRSHPFLFQDLLQQAALGKNRYFEDPSHLNRYGAAAVAAEVSKTLITPLSKMFPKAPSDSS